MQGEKRAGERDEKTVLLGAEDFAASAAVVPPNDEGERLLAVVAFLCDGILFWKEGMFTKKRRRNEEEGRVRRGRREGASLKRY